MNNTLQKLISILEKDERLVVDGELLKNKIIELANKNDKALLKLLKDNELIRKHFFVEVDNTLVFDKNKFIDFVNNKNFLADSYTKYKNSIGLSVGDRYFKENEDVVLAWPYKDCVLEGGQTKEDAKRDEVFHNETLAPDQIDRLLDPKVFTNFKKYTKDGEKELTGDEDIDFENENLIIKGNNLIALHSLKKKYAGKVKLIYIDPPFNTESPENTFKYNDKFKHSTWLSFMKNRLFVTKTLLAKDGVITIHIGQEECAYLKVLCDEIFGRENFVNKITVTTNDPSGFKSTSSDIFSTANFILVYALNKSSFEVNEVYQPNEYDTAYKYYFTKRVGDVKTWEWETISNHLAKKNGYDNSRDMRKKVGKDAYKAMIADFAIDNCEDVFRTAAISGGAKKKRINTIRESKNNRDEILIHPNEDLEDFYILNGEQILFYSDRFENVDGKRIPSKELTDVWTDIKWTGIAPEGDVTLKNGKKPEKLIKRILELFTKNDDIIMDFHLGSGTTCAVAQKMNRQFIGIEQIDYGKDNAVIRLNNVLRGEQSGISKDVNWQGGGCFVYCELAQWNEQYIQEIKKAKTEKELEEIYETMREKSFLSYKVNSKDIDETKKSYNELSFENKKRFLIELLDKNYLYIPYSEIEDKEFDVSEKDKKINKKFYRN